MAGEVSAGAAPYPKPNAQYRVAFLSPDISPVRVQGGQRLVARRTAPAGAFRSATERSEALSAEIGRNSPG